MHGHCIFPLKRDCSKFGTAHTCVIRFGPISFSSALAGFIEDKICKLSFVKNDLYTQKGISHKKNDRVFFISFNKVIKKKEAKISA